MTALRRWLAALPPNVILAFGFAVFVAYAFPGYMSSDSALQLLQGRSWHFTNQHPPIMAAEWGVLDRIISGPTPMLLLQGALFLGGLYVLLGRAMSQRTAAWLAIALFLYPPIMTTMAVIWKDSQMAAYLVAAIAALTSQRRGVRLVGLALATVACAMRYNGFAAVVPVVFVLFEWRPGLSWWKRYAISLVAAIACTFTALRVDRWLVDDEYWVLPAQTDIVGVLAFTDRTWSDADLLARLDGTALALTHDIQRHARALYNSRNSTVVSQGDARMFDLPQTAAQRDAVTRAWKDIVTGDVRAYLAYRADVFGEVLGLWRPPWEMVFHRFVPSPEEGDLIEHDAAASPVQAAVGDYLELRAHRRWFRPHFYLILALALLAACCRDRTTFALLASGVGCELSLFPTAGTPDFRYSHWLVATTSIAAVLLFVTRLRR